MYYTAQSYCGYVRKLHAGLTMDSSNGYMYAAQQMFSDMLSRDTTYNAKKFDYWGYGCYYKPMCNVVTGQATVSMSQPEITATVRIGTACNMIDQSANSGSVVSNWEASLTSFGNKLAFGADSYYHMNKATFKDVTVNQQNLCEIKLRRRVNDPGMAQMYVDAVKNGSMHGYMQSLYPNAMSGIALNNQTQNVGYSPQPTPTQTISGAASRSGLITFVVACVALLSMM
jgi:hypothetical protein